MGLSVQPLATKQVIDQSVPAYNPSVSSVGYAVPGQNGAPTLEQPWSPYLVDPSDVPSNIISGSNYAEQQEARQAAAERDQQVGYYDSQIGELNGLLGRTQTGLDQGLWNLENDYQKESGYQTGQKDKAMAGFAEKEVDTKKSKQNNYSTINKNANNGYRSLAQIIGRASGSGSSAFMEALPDAVGRDTSTKRSAANETYGTNMQRIDKGRGETELSFQGILEQLAQQRKDGEKNLRTEVEGQRQTINTQLGTLQGQRAAAAGGDINAVRAATDPYTAQVNASRDKVTSFFDQFKTPYVRKEATVATPELANYTADRSVVNAGGSQSASGQNPYADMLKKKLTEGQVA
jgi:hypothetical protein